MKKTFWAFLAAVLLLSAAACGSAPTGPASVGIKSSDLKRVETVTPEDEANATFSGQNRIVFSKPADLPPEPLSETQLKTVEDYLTEGFDSLKGSGIQYLGSQYDADKNRLTVRFVKDGMAEMYMDPSEESEVRRLEVATATLCNSTESAIWAELRTVRNPPDVLMMLMNDKNTENVLFATMNGFSRVSALD